MTTPPQQKPGYGYTIDQLRQAELDVLSMTEAEFMAAHHCTPDAMYRRLYPEVFTKGSREDLKNV